MTTTTVGKRRRYLTADSIQQSEEDNEELSNATEQLGNKRRGSATADLASPRFIVSERQQLAVLKQLTAGDESNTGSPLSSSVMLPQRPPKTHRRNEHGETILHIAARKGDLKRLKKALSDGANVNEEDNAGWTPLHEAVTKNQLKAARLLLKSGANTNAPGSEGQTPLIDAVLNNNTKMVELLLNYSADPSVVNVAHVNEFMLKVLRREVTTFDVSDNESLSPSSSISSADDSEHDEDKIERRYLSSHLSKSTRRKSFQHFHEHSSDSLSNNRSSTMDSDQFRKNPYDFESDDDEEQIRNGKQRTASGISSESMESKHQLHPSTDQSAADDELIQHVYRVPPLKIVLARAVVQHNTDMESNNSPVTEDNTSMEALSLPIIEENDNFLSTMSTSAQCNTESMTMETALASINDADIQSPETVISDLIRDIIIQIDEAGTLPITPSDEQEENLKTTTRSLRSRVKGKLDSSNSMANDRRRISSRKRGSDYKSPLDSNEKRPRTKTISECSNLNEASSNSDDHTGENQHEKIVHMEETTITGDEESNSDHSIKTTKQVSSQLDVGSLPPNKRRLRERNTALVNNSPPEDNTPAETTTTTRDIPKNGIKQFLDIRQQIEKRHEAMLHDFVLPKVPKDYSETLMAKKSYLVTPSFKSFSTTTPASLGIRRFHPPSDLDRQLADIFTRQEDERYRMKLRHQVEREKLILSHEQEILRLYGNATRSSFNQEIPLSYCSLLRDNEVYNDPSVPERHAPFLNSDYSNTELGKRGKHRWNGRSLIKWFEDSNLKYKRLSCEINQRQHLEATTLYSMQRMVWMKHLPKETSSSSRMNSFLSERYLPKVEINTEFWTQRETSPI